MVTFNPDGSIALPGKYAKQKADQEQRMKTQKCITIARDVVRFHAPKKCVLRITLSDKVTDNRFVENIHRFFQWEASVPSTVKKLNEKEFEVEIGTHFKRCSDCANLRGRYREFMYGNVVDKKGNCTFEGRKKTFCYEDHFE